MKYYSTHLCIIVLLKGYKVSQRRVAVIEDPTYFVPYVEYK